MKYPKIRAQANLQVKIPGFSGGINVHDTLPEIEDNQLTLADNVWWQNSALRTRPGMQYTGKNFDGAYSDGQWNGRQWVSDRETLVMHTAYSSSDNKSTLTAARLTQSGGSEWLAGGKVYKGNPTSQKTAPTAFGCVAPLGGTTDGSPSARYHIFISNGEILSEVQSYWQKASPYVPTLSINNRNYQALNMLTGEFKCTYRPDGERTLFSLPLENLTRNTGESVKVKVSLPNYDTGGAEALDDFTFEISPNDAYMENGSWVYVERKSISEQNIPNKSGYGEILTKALYVKFNWTQGSVAIFFYIMFRPAGSSGTQEKYIPLPAITKETITVDAWKTDESRRMKICKMTQCTWFGNSRLFVCGNPEEKNLIYWSDSNNPLYFPENNYVYVGNYSQAVTAMRRQGDLLAIFMENELHGMTYALGDDDAYDYAKEVGLDATSVSMSVALTSIHAGIGCDCPDSIRLVNNRLVWATSQGKVYMLPSVNQYNERNVRELSRNIFPLLSQHRASALKKSFAGEFYGYYVLLVDNVLYLLDSQASAFTSFNYYAKEEGAQKALAWYRWTLPVGEHFCMMANDTVMQIVVFEGTTGKIYSMDGDTDNGEPIACSFATKVFDFDRPDKKKAITRLCIGIGDSPQSMMNISYITEHDEYTDAWQMDSTGDYGKRDPGFMRTHHLTPNVSRSRVFGFRCDSVGSIAIGDILLKFKEQGVVR